MCDVDYEKIKDFRQVGKRDLNKVLELVSRKTGITKAAMKSKLRLHDVVFAKYYFFQLVKQKYPKHIYPLLTLEQIGAVVNMKHDSVIYGLYKLRDSKKEMLKYNQLFNEKNL